MSWHCDLNKLEDPYRNESLATEVFRTGALGKEGCRTKGFRKTRVGKEGFRADGFRKEGFRKERFGNNRFREDVLEGWALEQSALETRLF